MDHRINSFLKSACLGYSSEDSQGENEVEKSLQDITENTPATETNYEAGEQSIETPAFSPLTPKPAYASSRPILNTSSPVPPMSPKTVELLNMLESGEDFDSDDSVRDPDYQIDEFDDDDFSDNRSNMSVSIITTQASIHNTENSEGQKRKTINTCEGDVNRNNYSGTETDLVIHAHSVDSIQAESRSVADVEIVTRFDTNLIDYEEMSGRPRKGRKRKYGQLTREERKQRKYKNLSYVNYRKKQVDPKVFIDFKCKCSKKCHEKISVQNRQAEFNKFYDLGSYNAQNMYIAACVKERPVKRPYVSQNRSDVSKKKTYSRTYFLKDIQVCREMFVKTIQTTPKRINTSLTKMRSDSIADKRGAHGGYNKVSAESENFLINVINKLPKYVSHYGRDKVGNAKYLRRDMTFSKIYKLYSDEANSTSARIVSYAKAKHVFLTKFNLRIKPLKKDTCNKCDYFQNKKNSTTGEEEKKKIIEEHEAHLKIAESLQKRLKSDMVLAKNDPYTETITFDLQKTLPLPRIPTNIAFYKRQLWMYNLGIHTGSDDQGHCYVWLENEAGRGSQEVGSCLIKHLSESLKEGVTKLILWSDSCGGQNRNIKLTLMLKALLNDHQTLQQISLRYLEPGHTFLPNDTDFGKIESALKYQERIYLPEDYISTMRSCKKIKPFQVHRMESKDFYGSGKLENMITNRKKSITDKKIYWLKSKEILLKQEAMFSIFFRCSLDDKHEEVDIKKISRGRQAFITRRTMEMRWPNGKPIPAAKVKDIKSLMHLIPRDAHLFYKSLIGDDSLEDDVDGFSGEPDFDFEDEVDE